MADFDAPAWESLLAAIQEAWPEIRENSVILRVSQANRLNWADVMDRIDEGALSDYEPPWVLAQTGTRSPDPTWGLTNTVYRLPVWVYYIQGTTEETDVAAAVLAKLHALRDRLHFGEYAGFQVVEEPMLDASDENPANTVFFDRNAHLFAGLLQVSLQIGETAAVVG